MRFERRRGTDAAYKTVIVIIRGTTERLSQYHKYKRSITLVELHKGVGTYDVEITDWADLQASSVVGHNMRPWSWLFLGSGCSSILCGALSGLLWGVPNAIWLMLPMESYSVWAVAGFELLKLPIWLGVSWLIWMWLWHGLRKSNAIVYAWHTYDYPSSHGLLTQPVVDQMANHGYRLMPS
jgi:hypothetical protein